MQCAASSDQVTLGEEWATLHGMSTLYVILLIGATVRLTLLFTTDALLEPFRVLVEWRIKLRFAYMIRCDWCLSFWAGLAVFTFGHYAPPTLVLILTGALTASLVAGWLSTFSAAVEAKMWRDGEDG